MNFVEILISLGYWCGLLLLWINVRDAIWVICGSGLGLWGFVLVLFGCWSSISTIVSLIWLIWGLMVLFCEGFVAIFISSFICCRLIVLVIKLSSLQIYLCFFVLFFAVPSLWESLCSTLDALSSSFYNEEFSVIFYYIIKTLYSQFSNYKYYGLKVHHKLQY